MCLRVVAIAAQQLQAFRHSFVPCVEEQYPHIHAVCSYLLAMSVAIITGMVELKKMRVCLSEALAFATIQAQRFGTCNVLPCSFYVGVPSSVFDTECFGYRFGTTACA